MAGVTDERVRFENLAERGVYPEDPHLRWMVAGTAAINRALALASGDFVTPWTTDDEHARPDREDRRDIQSSRADLVFPPFLYETSERRRLRNEAESFLVGRVTTLVPIDHGLPALGWDPTPTVYRERGTGTGCARSNIWAPKRFAIRGLLKTL